MHPDISVPLAAFNLDELFEYLLPIGVMILYFFLAGRKKGEREEQKETEKRIPPPAPESPRRESRASTADPKKQPRTLAEQKVEPPRGRQILSPKIREAAIRDRRPPSLAKKLLSNRASLRRALLFQEILNPSLHTDDCRKERDWHL